MSAVFDFRLYHGNDLTLLAGLLAAELARPLPQADLLAPDTILIPQPAMKRWLQNALAEAHGIAANLRFLTPGEFVAEALAANLEDAGDAALAQAAPLRWRLWEVLTQTDFDQQPVFAPLQALLARDDRARTAWALAGELAAAFEKYQAWRRDWLQRWDAGADPQDWQAELWRRVSRGRAHRGARLGTYLARHAGAAPRAPRGLPARLFAFACQNVSPDVLRVIASAALAGPLHFYFVSPVQDWWGDLQTAAERRRDATPFEADEETPLLRANGAAGRDFLRLLFDGDTLQPGFELPLYAPPDPATRRGLLHRLQRDLLARRAPGAPDGEPALPLAQLEHDVSLQVHACATPLRELQVLHDRLRALFEADPSLQPRDVVVLAPDIARYAPQVHAVFGAPGSAADYIPYAVADAVPAAAQPAAAAFLRLLALGSSRFAASEVLELLAAVPLALRFGLERADLAALRTQLERAGVRWGLDAAHRRSQAAPADPSYTWQWGLDRLLLGHASGSDAPLAGVAPLPALEGNGLERFDALLEALRALTELQRELQRARPAAQWKALLGRALDTLFAAPPDDEPARRALDGLRARVARFADEAALAGVQTALPASVLQDWFAAALAEPEGRQPFLTGAVTFARMVPMRLIPFRVVCVLGLDDGAFPRRDPAGGLNRIDSALGTARRVGDRSLREDDRGLFLQLFAAAGDVLYLSYLGRDPRSGARREPSVVLAELLDVAAAAFDDPAPARAALVLAHPLQPFAPEAFGAGAARHFSYRREWRLEARPDVQPTAPFAAEVGAAAALPPAPSALALATLRRDLAHPPRAFLRERLGLQLEPAAPEARDDEPFGSEDALQRHGLRQRAFELLIAAEPLPDAGTLAERLLAEGWLAPAAAGVATAERLHAALRGAAAQWRRWAQGPARSEAFEVALDGVVLHGSFAPVHDSGLLQFRPGRAHGRTRLGLALEALCWAASGATRPLHRLLPEAGLLQVEPPLPAAQARAALQGLLDLRARVCAAALPLMPCTAWVYAEARAAGADEAQAFARAAREWEASREGSDPWVRLALRDADPFGQERGSAAAAHEFRRLAAELYALLQPVEGVFRVAA